MNSIPGFLALKLAIIASRPSCSPAPVHHENTSTWSLAASLGGSFGGSFAGSFTASLGGSFAGSFAFPHAVSQNMAAMLRVTWLITLFRIEQSPASGPSRVRDDRLTNQACQSIEA